MAYDLNADEIFEMAVRIEANGARFYRKAAGFQSDSQNRKMLDKLDKIIAEERKHVVELSALQKKL